MRVRYIGESFEGNCLTNGKVYECVGVEGAEDFGGLLMLRIIDDDLDDWNYDSRPDWKQGYLYSPYNPAPLNGSSPGGYWEIVEDDENGTLKKIMGNAAGKKGWA